MEMEVAGPGLADAAGAGRAGRAKLVPVTAGVTQRAFQGLAGVGGVGVGVDVEFEGGKHACNFVALAVSATTRISCQAKLSPTPSDFCSRRQTSCG